MTVCQAWQPVDNFLSKDSMCHLENTGLGMSQGIEPPSRAASPFSPIVPAESLDLDFGTLEHLGHNSWGSSC